MVDSHPPQAHALATLLQLGRRSRGVNDVHELAFVLVNETFRLVRYRQAALFISGDGVRALSGVSDLERNAPYVQWLGSLFAVQAASAESGAARLEAGDIPRELRDGWGEWLPRHAVLVPLMEHEAQLGALLLARDETWSQEEIALLGEWADMAAQVWRLRSGRSATRGLARFLNAVTDRSTWRHAPQRVLAALAPRRLPETLANLWRVRRRRYAALAVLVLFIPVRLTVLAPGELVAASPSVIRAPFDGIVERVLVQPNERVTARQPLFALDRTTLQARWDVAHEALITAQAEYRQQAQLAVFDGKGKARLVDLQGEISERQAEADYLRQQLERSIITAARDGIVMFEDPSEWSGKPVVTGERLATVAAEHDVEIEAWLAPGDLIDLPASPGVTLYLNTAPLSPVHATLRYVVFEATQRPDGRFAYRLRAAIRKGELAQRIGLQGTAKVSGKFVPLVYWMLRRPWATARQLIGV